MLSIFWILIFTSVTRADVTGTLVPHGAAGYAIQVGDKTKLSFDGDVFHPNVQHVILDHLLGHIVTAHTTDDGQALNLKETTSPLLTLRKDELSSLIVRQTDVVILDIPAPVTRIITQYAYYVFVDISDGKHGRLPIAVEGPLVDHHDGKATYVVALKALLHRFDSNEHSFWLQGELSQRNFNVSRISPISYAKWRESQLPLQEYLKTTEILATGQILKSGSKYRLRLENGEKWLLTDVPKSKGLNRKFVVLTGKGLNDGRLAVESLAILNQREAKLCKKLF